jgi:hypothetical protein
MSTELEKIWNEAVVACTIPAFAWRDWGKPQNASGRIAGLGAEI